MQADREEMMSTWANIIRSRASLVDCEAVGELPGGLSLVVSSPRNLLLGMAEFNVSIRRERAGIRHKRAVRGVVFARRTHPARSAGSQAFDFLRVGAFFFEVFFALGASAGAATRGGGDNFAARAVGAAAAGGAAVAAGVVCGVAAFFFPNLPRR